MKKKIIIASIVFVIVAIAVGFSIYKHISKGTVICTKNLLTEDYHTVDLKIDINFYKDQILDYSAVTLYTIKNDEKYEELIELLPNCNDYYINNGTIECEVEEKEVVKNYTLSRKYQEYMDDLEVQGFTCTKTYNG